jgi:hypothetical protein
MFCNPYREYRVGVRVIVVVIVIVVIVVVVVVIIVVVVTCYAPAAHRDYYLAPVH